MIIPVMPLPTPTVPDVLPVSLRPVRSTEGAPSVEESAGDELFPDLLAALLVPPPVVPLNDAPTGGGDVVLVESAPGEVESAPELAGGTAGLTIRLDGAGRPLAVGRAHPEATLNGTASLVVDALTMADPTDQSVAVIPQGGKPPERLVSEVSPANVVSQAEPPSESLPRPSGSEHLARAMVTPETVEPSLQRHAGMVAVLDGPDAVAAEAMSEGAASALPAADTAAPVVGQGQEAASEEHDTQDVRVLRSVDMRASMPQHSEEHGTATGEGQDQAESGAVTAVRQSERRQVAMVAAFADEIVAAVDSNREQLAMTRPPAATAATAAPLAGEPDAPAATPAPAPRSSNAPVAQFHHATVVVDRGDGSERIRVMVRGDTVHATILTTPTEHAALTSRVDLLRQALIDRGFGEVQVMVRATGGGEAAFAGPHAAPPLGDPSPDRIVTVAGRGSSEPDTGTGTPRGRTDDETASRQRSRHEHSTKEERR